jgi:ferrochelatase
MKRDSHHPHTEYQSSGDDYWSRARRPFAGLVFLAPILLLYEMGVYSLGGSHPELLRNGADHWMHVWLQQVGLDHPRYLEATVDRLREAVAQLPVERQQTVPLAFTAHSIPQGMADQCAYERQLREACRLVAEEVGFSPDRWGLVFQSRSGRPSDPWLEPDINVHLKNLAERGVRDVVVMPIGFLSDHMEVLYDLDFEARATCDALGLNLVRAATVGTHPLFIQMIRELIAEHLTPGTERLAVGACGPLPDACPLDCCPAPLRPTRPTPAS